MMKALVIYEPKKCRLEERPMPEITRPDQVIVRVRAVGICGSDMAAYLGAPTRTLPLSLTRSQMRRRRSLASMGSSLAYSRNPSPQTGSPSRYGAISSSAQSRVTV